MCDSLHFRRVGHSAGRHIGELTYKLRLRACGGVHCTVRDTVSAETQPEAERSRDVEVQTTLSVSPDSVHASGAGQQQQQQQLMLQQLLLQRHAHRAPVDQPRKGSAPEVGRTAAAAPAPAAGSAFRPVLTARTGDWSPSRRTQHGPPRLPYFQVRSVAGGDAADAGRRYFRPINGHDQPPASTDDRLDDLGRVMVADSGTGITRSLGPFHGAIAVPSVTRCRCCCRGHRTPPAL